MQEGEPGDAVKKGHNRGTRIEAFRIRAPCLKRATRNVKHLGGLTLGNPLGVQLAISFKEVSAFEASPALVALIIATLLCLDYRYHSYLPTEALPCAKWRAKDGEVAT